MGEDGQCRLIAIAIRVWAPINLTRLRLQLQTRRVRFSKRIDKKRESGESRAECPQLGELPEETETETHQLPRFE